MTRRFQLLISSGVLLALLLSTVFMQAQITPSDDAYINSATPTTNFGAAVTLNVQNPAQTGFIRFDLTAIPSTFNGSSVAKATLKLYVNTVTTAGSVNVDYVTGAWIEKTITSSLQPSLGTTIVGSIPLTPAGKNKYLEVDITPAVVAWLNGTQANNGIALVANSPLVATFDSKENIGTSHPPELDIVFTGPGSSGITGITTAAGSGLTGGGTSGTLNMSLLKTCSTKQVLQWNGTAWACSTIVGSGTITGVTAGTGLTGGGTSGNVTLNLNTTTTDARYAQLGVANAFTQSQAVNGTSQTLVQATSSGLNASVIYGHSTNTSNAGASQGVLGIADGPIGIGVFGASNGSSGIGVEGKGSQNGVLGYTGSNSTIWSNYSQVGVHGDSGASSGTGVLGTVDSGLGVQGVVTSAGSGVYGVTAAAGGNTFGVLGASTNATAVRGNDAASGTGVSGTSVAGFGIYGSSYGVSGQSFGPAAVVGDSSTATGVWGVSAASDGVNGVNRAGASGMAAMNGGSGYGLYSTAATTDKDYGVGVRGETFGAGVFPNGFGSDGVQGLTHTTNGAGVSGINYAAGGAGVFGTAINGGFGFATPNDVQQARGASGWIKAMVFVDPFTSNGTAITRCFNSALLVGTNSPPCGINITHLAQGVDLFDFSHQVNDRFFSTTSFPIPGALGIISNTTATTCVLDSHNPCVSGMTANQIVTVTTTSNGNTVDVAFWVIVY
jgi:hypothetical protein